MKRKHQVGCPCCGEYTCDFEHSLNAYTQEAGSWTFTTSLALVTTSDAMLISSQPITGQHYRIIQCRIRHGVSSGPAGNEAIMGWRTQDGNSRVYIKTWYTVSGTNNTLHAELCEDVGGTVTVLEAANATYAFSPAASEASSIITLQYDQKAETLSAFVVGAVVSNQVAFGLFSPVTVRNAQLAFVGTEDVSERVSFENKISNESWTSLHYHQRTCLAMEQAQNGYIGKGSLVTRITVSGVTGGTGDCAAPWNDTWLILWGITSRWIRNDVIQCTPAPFLDIVVLAEVFIGKNGDDVEVRVTFTALASGSMYGRAIYKGLILNKTADDIRSLDETLSYDAAASTMPSAVGNFSGSTCRVEVPLQP